MSKMMDIVCLVIFIAVQSLCYENTGKQEVRITELEHNLRTQDPKRLFSILDSKPLDIVFEDFHATTVQCRAGNFTPSGNILYINRTTVLRIPKVISYMSTKWKCVLIDVSKMKTVYIFEMRIKAAKTVSAVIATRSLKFTLTNETVLEYEAFNEYMCEEGETIDLTCSYFYDEGSLVLRYYNANGTKMVETDEINRKEHFKNALDFRLLMRPEANRSYVDCTYFTAADKKKYRQEFTYRITFIMSNDIFRNNYFTVAVNDMKLTGKPSNGSNYNNTFNYNFIYGENLTITCETKNKGKLADILMGIRTNSDMNATASSNGTHISTKDIEKTSSKYRFSVETTYLDKAIIECSTLDFEKNEFYRAYISFKKESYEGPAITGMRANNLLYQYSKNHREWVAHYEYTLNKTLQLTCIITKNVILRWYEGETMLGGTKGQNPKIGIWYISDMFILNQKSIICESEDSNRQILGSWKIILHLEENNHNMEEEHSNVFVIIGCALAVLIVMLLSAACVFYWCKKLKTTIKRETPFRKFSENNNPIPEAMSWRNDNEYAYITNEYKYIDNEVNSLYCGNIPGNTDAHRRKIPGNNHPENYYTEIDDYDRKETDKKPLTKFSKNDNPTLEVKNRRHINESTYIKNECNYIENVENSLYCGSIQDNIDTQGRNISCNGHSESHYTEIDDYGRKEKNIVTTTDAVTYDHKKYENVLLSSPSGYDNL